MAEQSHHLRFLDDEIDTLVPIEPVKRLSDVAVEAVIGGGKAYITDYLAPSREEEKDVPTD